LVCLVKDEHFSLKLRDKPHSVSRITLVFAAARVHSSSYSQQLVFTAACIHSSLYSQQLVFTAACVRSNLCLQQLVFAATSLDRVGRIPQARASNKASEGGKASHLEVGVAPNHDPKDPSKRKPSTGMRCFSPSQELKRWNSSVWLRLVVDVGGLIQAAHDLDLSEMV